MLEYETTANRNKPLRQSSRLEEVCPLCGDHVPPKIRGLHALAEQWVLTQIKKDHPEWVEADGLCPKCLDHYQNLLWGETHERS